MATKTATKSRSHPRNGADAIDNKVALRSVTLGERVGQDYIITEGVKAGERIIIEGLQKARPGATVNPTARPATAETATGKQGE